MNTFTPEFDRIYRKLDADQSDTVDWHEWRQAFDKIVVPDPNAGAAIGTRRALSSVRGIRWHTHYRNMPFRCSGPCGSVCPGGLGSWLGLNVVVCYSINWCKKCSAVCTSGPA